jgi:hypothetical protein
MAAITKNIDTSNSKNVILSWVPNVVYQVYRSGLLGLYEANI